MKIVPNETVYYDFLFIINSNYVAILNISGDTYRPLKTCVTSTDLSRSLKVRENTANWNFIYDFLSVNLRFEKVNVHRRTTDGRTDGRTDGQQTHRYQISSAWLKSAELKGKTKKTVTNSAFDTNSCGMKMALNKSWETLCKLNWYFIKAKRNTRGSLHFPYTFYNKE